MGYVAAFLALVLLAIYTLRRRLLSWLLELPPARYAVSVRRNIPLSMDDGVRLLTDHYWPKGPGQFPTILIRTPYGRGKELFLFGGYALGEMPAQRFAERGFHVIVQGVRGCYDSQGTFEPHVNEAADGQATARWIAEQPWFDGRLAAWGPSYLGYTAWATATHTVPQLKAIMPFFTSSENYSVTHPDGVFGLECRLRWAQGLALARQRHDQSFVAKLRQRFANKDEESLQVAFGRLPLLEADETAVGRPVPIYRDMLANNAPDDEYWRNRDHSGAVGEVTAAAHLIGGWYDYYLRGLLRDYNTLKVAGREPCLTIGPWYHASGNGLLFGLREGLKWFDSRLKDSDQEVRHQPVRIYVMGADEWREMPDFPPKGQPTAYYLHGDGRLLSTMAIADLPTSNFTYDPADPTPVLGGALLAFKGAGPVDNRPLESRNDVLMYTSEVLQEPVEAVGKVSLILYVRSSRSHTDFFARLCDVHLDGRSINVCDGLVRVNPGTGKSQTEGTLRIEVDLWATAYQFRSGHRLRLLVASGAHPRWNRNLGLGQDEATAVELATADQTIYHDPEHPSALILPLILKSQ